MLTELSLSYCRKLKKLPKFVCMESLETVILKRCTSLQEFPEICGDMHCLSRLDIGSPWIRSLPPSLSSLIDLELTDCEALESIPDTYQNLRELRISGCNKLATLPNNLFESERLDHIKIYRCSELVELPVSLGVTNKLCWLEIERCENLKKLPSSIQMESLEKIKICNSPKLDTFPEIKGDMHCLNILELNSTRIKEVPSYIWHLRGLEYLNLEGYEDLVSLPDSLCNLMNLKDLTLGGCKKLEKLPENIGDLRGLKSLNLEGCEDLVSLPDSLCNLTNLEYLPLGGCKKLKKLPENIGDL